jgi:RNA polymerase sigma factor (sigma-70 family)
MRPSHMSQSTSQSASTNLASTTLAILYEKYWLAILVYVRQVLPSLEDAEDVLVEVFLAALESDILASLPEKQQLAWLRRVAYNKAIDYHRRSVRRPAVSLEVAMEALFDDEELAPERVAMRNEEAALLQTRIAELPASQQQVLQLRFGDGLRCAEIARRMNRSEGAIRTLLSRTLNLLRNIYDKGREGAHHE